MSRIDSPDSKPTSERQVLFLDFDGTIHRYGALRTRRGIVSSAPDIKLFEFAPVLAECIRPYEKAEIVLSTSWVRALGYQRAKNALPTELRERVVGATYHSKFYDTWAWPAIGRGIQILRYVEAHHVTKWVAIDDEVDGFDGYLLHVVQCGEMFGLGDERTRCLLRVRLAEQFG
jgi:hypothetical protein